MASASRTSTLCVFVPPTGSNSRSCNARSSLTCSRGLAVAISSRNSVPPSASRNLPGLSVVAPVKAPLTWPNSSLSSRFSGSAPQATSTNGPPLRPPAACRARAVIVLPVPLSPRINTVVRVSATDSISSNIRCMR